MSHGPSGSSGAIPCPPYLGASLLQSSRHRLSNGGASSGSGAGVKSRSQSEIHDQQPIAVLRIK